MTGKKKPKRAGLLAEPLPAESKGLISRLLVENDRYELIKKKMYLLLQEYGIDEDNEHNWFFLAFFLARDYEPGFREKRKGGRKLTWTTSKLKALIIDMEKLIVEGDPTHGETWAANELAKDPYWSSIIKRLEGSEPDRKLKNIGEPLRARYSKNKNNELAKVAREKYAKLHENGNPEEMERWLQIMKN